MEGEIHITAEEVNYNGIGWTSADFFKDRVSRMFPGQDITCYARIFEDGKYIFKYRDKTYIPSEEYLKALEEMGWTVLYNRKVREKSGKFIRL